MVEHDHIEGSNGGEIDLDTVTARLMRALSSAPTDEIAGIVRQHMVELDAVEDAIVWLVDVALERLQSLSGDEVAPIDDSSRARAFTHGDVASIDGVTYIPLRTDELVFGVMELHGECSDELVESMRSFGAALTTKLLATQSHSDLVPRVRNFGSLSLPATIQHNQSPPAAFGDASFEIGSKIEPAFDVAGDGYDYAVNGRVADFGLFDAVGHGLRSTLLSTVALGAYRLHRWRQESLGAVAGAVDAAVAAIADDGEFVTGILCRMTSDGDLEVANAGHLPPLRVSDGEAAPLAVRPSLPFGLGNGDRSVQRFHVASQETIYIISDGVIEAQSPMFERFGRPRLASVLADQDPSRGGVLQTCRAVLLQVLSHVESRLSDDATILGVRRR